MANLKWSGLLVIVAFGMGGVGGYVIGVRQAASPGPMPHAPPPTDTTSTITGYDFTQDTPCRVVRVVDGDTVDLEVGGKPERFRLIGIDTPETVHPHRPVEYYGQEAALFVRNLLEGESVYLRDGSEKIDPYGRRLAYLFRASDGLFVNLEIVRQGYGKVLQVRGPFKHLDLFLKYERQAVDAKKGVWAADAGPVRTPAEAAALIGKRCTVEFEVGSVGHGQSGVMFLNSKADYRDPGNFSAFIGAVAVEKYRRAGVVPVVEFARKWVRVTGTVSEYQGRTQIIVNDPGQVAMVVAP